MRSSYLVHRSGSKELGALAQRHAFRGTALLEAHLPLSRSRVLRLLTSSLLPWSKVSIRHQGPQLHQARPRDCHCRRSGIWAVRVLRTDSSAANSAVPFLTGFVSCILGSKYMGDVLIQRSSFNTWLVYYQAVNRLDGDDE